MEQLLCTNICVCIAFDPKPNTSENVHLCASMAVSMHGLAVHQHFMVVLGLCSGSDVLAFGVQKMQQARQNTRRRLRSRQ